MNTPTDGYQPNAIVKSSWGYDQTNIDFFRISKRTNNTVFLIPLNSASTPTQDMRGLSIPAEPMKPGDDVSCLGQWNGRPIRRRLCYRGDTPIGFSIKHGWASLWDGTPAHWTAYA